MSLCEGYERENGKAMRLLNMGSIVEVKSGIQRQVLHSQRCGGQGTSDNDRRSARQLGFTRWE